MEQVLYEISCELGVFNTGFYILFVILFVVSLRLYFKKRKKLIVVAVFYFGLGSIGGGVDTYFDIKECKRKEDLLFTNVPFVTKGFPQEINNTEVFDVGGVRFDRDYPYIHNGGPGCWDGVFVKLPIEEGDVIEVKFLNPTREERIKCILSIVKLNQKK